jgi:CheY-like chemotaxis protein
VSITANSGKFVQLSHLSNAQIFVADPVPFSRRLIGDLFSDGKCGRVDFFDNGASLIEACSSSCPDIIIIDDRLPFIFGVELLRTMSNLPSFHEKSPIFVLLAEDTTKSAVEEAISGGFAFVIKKPFVPSYLMQIVRQIILDQVSVAS